MKQTLQRWSLLVLLSSVGSVFSQESFSPGWVVDLSGDTLRGEIQVQRPSRMSETCVFRAAPGGNQTAYAPGEILEYRILDGKYYVSKEPELNGRKSAAFLEYILDGEADLFLYREQGSLYFFIEDRNGRLSELKNTEVELEISNRRFIKEKKEYLDTLEQVFAATPELQPELKQIRFNNHNDLIQITSRYHDLVCEDGKPCIVYHKETKLTSRFGLSLGYTFSNLRFLPYNSYFNYLNANPIARGNTFSGSLRYAASNLFGFSEYLSLHTGLGLSYTTYSNDIHPFTQTGLFVPVVMRRNLTSASRMFFQIGCYNHFNFDNRAGETAVANNAVLDATLGIYQLSALGGVGVEAGNLSLSVNYLRTTSVTGLGSTRVNLLSSIIHGVEVQMELLLGEK